MGQLDCDGGGHNSADRPTGNYPFMDTSAFLGTDPTDKPITSGLPAIR